MTTLAAPTSPPAVAHDADCALGVTGAIAPRDFQKLRRTMQLQYYKWDSQVEDLCALADFALTLTSQQWKYLAQAVEQLTQETFALEQAVLNRPDLHKKLALPRAIRNLFNRGDKTNLTPTIARVMRFDFHPTAEGWRLSEVNTDVPGGYTEASAYTQLMRRRFPSTEPAGNPACDFADAIATRAQRIALLAAPGLIEDHQVIANLACLLQQRGCQTHLAQPRQLNWKTGHAHIITPTGQQKLDAIVRFYQAEWLAMLPRRVEWKPLFVDGNTPVTNPAVAALSESKRLPLVWNDLDIELSAWPRFLPETRDPRDAPWRQDESWLLKSAYCNNGESIAARDIDTKSNWRAARIDHFLHPNQWIAQKRFQTTTLQTPRGPMHPCIGVYTINARAAGIYARLSPRAVVDYRAIDVPVLITTT